MPVKHILAANIRRERIRAGLTQAELGTRIGVSASRVSQYESTAPYTRLPSVRTLERIGEALGVPIRQFFEEPTATGILDRRL